MSYVLESLRDQSVIGYGATGKVGRVTLPKGKEVTVKKILKKRNEFEAYIETLGFIKHVNILKLLCSISSAESHFNLLIFEYIQNGSLFDFLHGSESMAMLEWPVQDNTIMF